MSQTTSAKTITVHHVEVRTHLPAAEVHRRLLATLPRLDPRLVDMLSRGDVEAVEKQRRDGPPLWLFEVRDMGALLAVEKQGARVVYQYEIGNPLTAESMVRYRSAAGLYAPLRVVLYEEPGGSVFAFDRPFDLFGQFGDPHVTQVGQELDRELEAALRKAID